MASDAYAAVRKLAVDYAVIEKNHRVRADPGTQFTGPRISLYQASVGIGKKSYCVAFVYWCYQMACNSLGQPNILPRTGSTRRLSQWAHPEWYLKPGEMPEPGDIWMRREKRHTGMVWYVNGGRADVITVEGNTYTYADPHWGVHGRKRDMSTNTIGILRPTW